MSAARKSKGGGTVLLLVFLCLAIAGGSAWVIHAVLSGKEIPFTGDRGESASSQPASASGPDASGQDASGQGSSVTGRLGEAASGVPASVPGADKPAGQNAGQDPVTLPGGVVVESIPGGAANVSSGIPEPPPHVSFLPHDSAGGASAQEGEGASSPMLLVAPGAEVSPSVAPEGDSVVRPAFVADIARFLAQTYWPKGTHPSAKKQGITTASLRWANLRYGAELRNLDGRQAVLDYVLNPATIGKLYSLYAGSFVTALVHESAMRTVGTEGAERFLTATEKKEMFGIYAAYAARLANALERYATTPGMAGKVEAYAAASARVEEANKTYMESVIAHENSMTGSDTTLATAARLKRDKEAATYQKRIRERESARRSLVTAMGGSRAGDGSDNLVYAAFWAHRRGTDSAPALKACAKALFTLSERLTAAAKGF